MINFKKLDTELTRIANDFAFTNVIGLSRSILAIGTLLTLLNNPVSNFFYRLTNGDPSSPILLENSIRNKVNLFLILGFDYVWIMKIFAILVLLLVISGYYPKISSVFHWWVAWSFMSFSSAIDGGDQIANNLSLLFIPICFLDNRKNHWDIPKENSILRRFSGFYFIQIIRLQVALIYFHASVGKLPVIEWAEGTAVYYWFNNGAFGLPGYLHTILDPLLSNSFFVMCFSYGTIIFELVLFLCFTMPIKYRKQFFLLAIIFHGSIIFFHGIFSFFFSMAACLIIFLKDYNHPIKFKSWKKSKSSLLSRLFS